MTRRRGRPRPHEISKNFGQKNFGLKFRFLGRNGCFRGAPILHLFVEKVQYFPKSGRPENGHSYHHPSHPPPDKWQPLNGNRRRVQKMQKRMAKEGQKQSRRLKDRENEREKVRKRSETCEERRKQRL